MPIPDKTITTLTRRVCCIAIPEGYKDAEDFANDCGFELVRDVVLMGLKDGYTFIRSSHYPFNNKTAVTE